jgi:hypothetical protein
MAHSVLSAFIPEACPNLNKPSFDLKKLPNDSAVDQKLRDRLMKKILSLAAMVTMLAVASSAADAKGPGGVGGGASSFSPGQSFRNNGPVTGTNAASGYAPGHQMQTNGPVNGSPGAAGYAPGKLKH